VVEHGGASRYAYWSERRIRSIAEDQGINLNPRWKTRISVIKVPFVPVGVDLDGVPRTLNRNEVASRIERAIGDLAVEDFVTSPPVKYAKGVGPVEFSHFMCNEPNRVILHTHTTSSDDTRTVVCLFGSRDDVAGFVGVHDSQVAGWTPSAMWSIVDWLATQCTVNNSQWDDPESISVEAMKIATHQGTNDRFVANPDQPWTRGFTFGETPDAEWFAEIYSDVVLDKNRWSLETPVDRILVGAPLWIRTPRSTTRRYRDYRRDFNRDDYV
jgi:hypothetical protein